MNRTRRSRLSSIAVLVIVSMAVVGCNNCDVCFSFCGLFGFGFFPFCLSFLCPVCLSSDCSAAISEFCEDNPDECAGKWEQFHLAAIEFCQEYPQECQEVFDAWVGALDEEAE